MKTEQNYQCQNCLEVFTAQEIKTVMEPDPHNDTILNEIDACPHCGSTDINSINP